MANPAPIQESPELQAAEVAKREAQASASRAQAESHAAYARLNIAEAEIAELSLTRALRAEAAELSKDEHARVYRFLGQVNGPSVALCIAKLTEWHRQDPKCGIEIVFSSPGGSIIEGFMLFDFVRSLSREGHVVVTGCLGMAASMAGILLQMGDVRWVGQEGWIMIHRAAFGASGKTFDVEDEVAWVKRVEKRIVDIFVKRSGGKLSAAKLKRNWDRKDWWLTSDEALELGVVDEIR